MTTGRWRARAACEELHRELVKRDQQRGGRFSDGKRLITRPALGDSERDRRNSSWPGFHTEHHHVDVRHGPADAVGEALCIVDEVAAANTGEGLGLRLPVRCELSDAPAFL